MTAPGPRNATTSRFTGLGKPPHMPRFYGGFARRLVPSCYYRLSGRDFLGTARRRRPTMCLLSLCQLRSVQHPRRNQPGLSFLTVGRGMSQIAAPAA